MKEGDLIKAIFDEFYTELNEMVERINTGAYKVGKRWIRYGVTGKYDMELIVPPYGRVVGVECKKKIYIGDYKVGAKKGQPRYDIGVQSDEQKEYQERFEANGGIYVLAYDLPEVREAVDLAKRLPEGL